MGLLGDKSAKITARRARARSLVVHGERFTNSAAKFWPALIDELAADHPHCDAIILEMLTDPVLDRELLFPVQSLQRELDRYQGRKDFGKELREALSQFAMIGPPGAVQARLLAGATQIAVCDLPLDCVDADVFPCLLVWLLEWAEISQSLWNNPTVSGAFQAWDHERKISYRLQFDLGNEHISEGLYRRTLTLHFVRQV